MNMPIESRTLDDDEVDHQERQEEQEAHLERGLELADSTNAGTTTRSGSSPARDLVRGRLELGQLGEQLELALRACSRPGSARSSLHADVAGLLDAELVPARYGVQAFSWMRVGDRRHHEASSGTAPAR